MITFKSGLLLGNFALRCVHLFLWESQGDFLSQTDISSWKAGSFLPSFLQKMLLYLSLSQAQMCILRGYE